MASVGKCRNLSKNQLGGVVFGCTNNTKNECITKKLFGLPAQHFSYVKNIEPGLPLFLFNYSERKLYGIYEAVSSGKMYIDSYGWTSDGSERTRYPAQVQVRMRLECQALSENLFKPIIIDNYYSQSHFLFELDHIQASKLISKLTSLALAPSMYTPRHPQKSLSAKRRLPVTTQRKEPQAQEPLYFTDDFANSDDSFGILGNSDDSLCLDGGNLLMEVALSNQNDGHEEQDLICMKLKELARQYTAEDMTGQFGEVTRMEDVDLEHETYKNGMSTLGDRNNESPFHSLDSYATIARLCQEMEELKTFKQEQTCKIETLEKKLVEAELEIRRLGKVCMRFESAPETSMTVGAACDNQSPVESPDLNQLIFLVGGFDGVSWSSALNSYSPKNDVLKSLKSMSCVRSYASVAMLNKELYIFGGGDGSLLYDTVESYNPVNDQWTFRPSLTKKKGHLASATIHGKIFAVGGGNGAECFSDVEMFDSEVGRWISTRSMLQKRFALAAVELNGALYAVGGYDGIDYLMHTGDNNQVAVKRLREKITKANKEFEIELARLGKIRHPNILALRAYYMGPKGEKLLVYDCMPNGSLSSFLHARGPETNMPWKLRMDIAIGITEGLHHLHTDENVVHGNLTSSIVLLDEKNNPKIADVGLSHLITNAAKTDIIATAGTLGYRAPELSKLKNANTKTDIYGLGVIILELLTGKSPCEATERYGLDLPQWVSSIVKEEWTNEVFDIELMKDASNIGEDLLKTLKLALHCVDPLAAARPETLQVLQKLEEIQSRRVQPRNNE
ncbi:ring canal kelch [Dorcoceras hygrometricum]|uniref:Ring canal kelch n=1 Tax=Dorcoceras hygrometricum TaxID=472368 RepID=A0A2Z7A8J9_9LAMI|nr:ring canal kelch [Dorcoceras hygrometricum]